MKQLLCKASLLLMVALPMACSNDTDNDTTEDKRITIDAGNLQFSIAEAAFGADTEIQMCSAKPIIARQEVNLGESVEAEISIERDPAPAATRAPKPMSDGNYTIVAYKDGVRIQQKLTFTVSSGFVTYTSSRSAFKSLPTGSYSFVCFNDKVQDNNDGTFTVDLANAETALINHQSATYTQHTNTMVFFTMQRMGARVRTKLIAAMEPTGVNGTLGYLANRIPASADYKVTYTAGSYIGSYMPSTNKNTSPKDEAQAYNVSGTVNDATLGSLNSLTGNQYLSVLAGTKPEDLVYSITGGSVYNSALNTNGTRSLKGSIPFQANGSYTLTIKILPRYLYLYEDGKTGHLKDADRQSHVPIAIVFDATGKRAIALWDANGGNKMKWNGESSYEKLHNDVYYNTSAVLQPGAGQGKHWTWDASGSKDGTTIKANEPTNFPVFYYAGKFYNSPDLTSHLNGKTLVANLNQDGVWYLPSQYEWKEVFVKLGMGDGSQVVFSWGGMYPWKGNMVNYAFVAANGTSIATNSNRIYWSSSENSNSNAYYVIMRRQNPAFTGWRKNEEQMVRPFVAY